MTEPGPTARGFAAGRHALPIEGFRRMERRLSDRPLRVFDFNMGPEDLAQNLHDGRRFRDDYAGAPGARGAPVFRADHHYPVAALARESTTPLVLRWLLGLHQADRGALIECVAGGRHLANHWDADLLFSHHLALEARDVRYLEQVGPALAAAALRNDYLEPPPPGLQPQAGTAFYAGLALEHEIDAGRTTFDAALERWLPALGRLLRGSPDDEASTVARWAAAEREAEQQQIARFAGWHAEGRIEFAAGGRLVWLEAPEFADNATFYLYLREAHPLPGPRIQLLSIPCGTQRVYKLRSHGGLDLHSVFDALNARAGDPLFAGRSAAGGSRPTGLPAAPLVELLRDMLDRGRLGRGANCESEGQG